MWKDNKVSTENNQVHSNFPKNVNVEFVQHRFVFYKNVVPIYQLSPSDKHILNMCLVVRIFHLRRMFYHQLGKFQKVLKFDNKTTRFFNWGKITANFSN